MIGMLQHMYGLKHAKGFLCGCERQSLCLCLCKRLRLCLCPRLCPRLCLSLVLSVPSLVWGQLCGFFLSATPVMGQIVCCSTWCAQLWWCWGCLTCSLTCSLKAHSDLVATFAAIRLNQCVLRHPVHVQRRKPGLLAWHVSHCPGLCQASTVALTGCGNLCKDEHSCMLPRLSTSKWPRASKEAASRSRKLRLNCYLGLRAMLGNKEPADLVVCT